ncbi:hypothetical protein BH11PSE9_BH11PSE9_01550 [soil metagenome]
MLKSKLSAMPGWVAAALACVLVRGLWMIFVHAEPIADYAFYYTRALDMAAGNGYRYQGHPTAFFPVGTSLILAGPFALLGGSVALAKFLSLLAWTASVVLTYRLALLAANARTAWLAAFIVALHPDFIAFSGLTASENFFIPLLLGCVLAFCEASRSARGGRWSMALAGLLFGASMLVRSTSLLLVPLLALLVLIDRRRSVSSRLVQLLLFGLATALVLTPWVLRNAKLMGQPLLTTNGGIALWWGNNPHASGGFPLTIEPPPQNLATVNDEVVNNARLSAQAMAYIRQFPQQWIALAPAKFAFLFGAESPDIGFSLRHRYVGGPDAIEFHPLLGDARRASEAAYVERELTPVESRFIGAYYHLAGGKMGALWQWALWGLGLVGWVLLWVRERAGRTTVALLALIPAAWVLFHITLGNGQPRYMLSVAPLAVIGVAYLGSLLPVFGRARPGARASRIAIGE